MTFTRLFTSLAFLLILLPGLAVAQEQGTVRGIVMNSVNDAHLAGATVELVGTPHTVTTGDTGRYRLTGVAPGTYQIRVSYISFEEYVNDITVSGDGAVDYDIRLTPALGDLEEVMVMGARLGESQALNEQKEAANIKNVVSEELIEAFPDLNTAEVLQRVPGITIQRDMGEGRFVSIRGTTPAATQVLINGQQVAFSNENNRQVELDVVSAAQLSGIEVSKVITSDMDATAIGGTINLKTRGAFDYSDMLLNARAGLGQNSIADDLNYNAEVNFADTFGADNNIGFSLGVNFARTERERHNNEHRWDDEEDVNGNELPMELGNTEIQFSKNRRDRLGINARFDYQFDADNWIYLSGVFNYREDTQDRQIKRVRFDRGDYLSQTEVEGARMVKSLHDRVENQEISNIVFGGDHLIGEWNLDYSLSTSSAYTKKDDGQLRPEFEARGFDLLMSNLETRTPDWAVTNGLDEDNGDLYKLDVVDLKYENTTSDIDTYALNLSHPLQISSDSGEIKFGAKYKRTQKDRQDLRSQWRWEGDDDLLLSQFEPNLTPVILDNGYDLGPDIDQAAFREFFFSNQGPGGFEEEIRNDVNLGEPYDADEDLKAAYIMTNQTYGNLLMVAGLRYESYDLDYTASNLVMNDDELVSNEMQTVSRSHDFVFPNLQFRYRPSENTNWRFAYSQGIAQPNFFDAMPYSFTQIDDEEIVRGNPDLDFQESQNLDVLVEHFLDGIGIISGGIFYKKLDNFYFEANYIQVGGPFDGFEVSQFLNGGGADLYGAEINWQQQFTNLPGFWSNFGVFLNYTYTDAKNIDLGDEVTREDIAALPMQAQHTGNAALTYETERFLSRLALNYSGKWIEEVGPDSRNDEWRDSATTIDFSASYRFGASGFEMYFQANNITDEKQYNYLGVSTRSYQYDIYGRSFDIGVKWDY